MFSKFLSYTFWISNEPYLKSTLVILVLVFGVLLAFGMILRTMSRKQKGNPMNSVFKKASFAAFTMSMVGFVLLLLSWERVSYLGMRINYIFWLIATIIWSYFLYKRYKSIPSIQRDIDSRAEFEKYLPKKKS